MHAHSLLVIRCVACLGLVLPLSLHAQSSTPLRLLEKNDRFDLSLTHLDRVEFLQGQYRRAHNGTSDQVFIYRTTVEGRLKGESLDLNVELLDARQALADSGTPLTRRSVDAFNLQQLYLTWKWNDLVAEGTDVHLHVGRQAMNIGTRRIVSRSTSNVPVSFTGISTDISRSNGDHWKAFAVIPVLNYPISRQDILDNRAEADRESRGSRLYGVHADLPTVLPGVHSEFYTLHLSEQDAGEEQVADLRLTSVGTHLYTEAAPRAVDYDLETVLQFGTSRASSDITDVRDLRHRAFFTHAALGYGFDGPMLPYVQVLYDYASGDRDPTDGENNGYDTFFGARRSEFGPSSLYGPFTRTNLSTLGLRLTLTPTPDVEMIFTLRQFDLAQSRDGWGNTGWQDASGRSGRHLGRHLETRLRWDAIPGNLALDTGLVWLRAGEFPRRVSAGTAPSLTRYAYLQTTLFF
ncbi:MAG: alginate export family protein [Pseudomonadales bacterium]|nr:alginate export family protein [Pseudomonadales bacterium]MCP5356727.1 alginate export family protein [Pseudomonadales bacterium]